MPEAPEHTVDGDRIKQALGGDEPPDPPVRGRLPLSVLAESGATAGLHSRGTRPPLEQSTDPSVAAYRDSANVFFGRGEEATVTTHTYQVTRR